MDKQTPPNVGEQIRALRRQRGLSLRALAELCDLSPNTISLIERGVTSPSVSTLHRLAMALGVPIASLFEDRVEKAQVILTRADERPRSGSASVVLESLGLGLEEQACDPFLVTLKSGADSGDRAMVHSGYELAFCLQGELDYDVAGEKYRLEEGDALLFHADLPHRWHNPNSKPAVFLLIMQSGEDPHESVNQHLHP
jgi:transcriptional regulator with XRE-family HTH domain